MTDNTNDDELYRSLFGPAPAKEYTAEEEALYQSIYGSAPRRDMTPEELETYNAVYSWDNVPEHLRPANPGTIAI